jgi:hypothetical protein
VAFVGGLLCSSRGVCRFGVSGAAVLVVSDEL